MKKILVLMSSLILAASVSACAKEEAKPKEDAKPTITMQDIDDAHQMEKMLENNESVHLNWIYEGEEYLIEYYTEDYYYDRSVDYYAETDPEIWERFISDIYYSATNGEHICFIAVGEDGLAETAVYEEMFTDSFLREGLLEDEITSVTEENGMIIVNTVMDKDAIAEITIENKEGWLVGGKSEYALDAETLAPIYNKDVFELSDGSTREHIIEFTYNVEMPEGMKAFVEYDNQTEDVRTGTFIFNPGTDNEITETISIPKGLKAYLFDGTDSEKWRVFADEACTVEMGDPDDNADFICYVKPIE